MLTFIKLRLQNLLIINVSTRDNKILGWCPAGSVGEGASLALAGHPSSDAITIKIPYGVDVLLHRPAWHPIFS